MFAAADRRFGIANRFIASTRIGLLDGISLSSPALASRQIWIKKLRTSNTMRKLLIVTAVLGVALVCTLRPGRAQDKPMPKYEYAIVKWDGPDRLYYNLPDKFEMVHITKSGVKIPGEAQEEEYCLAYAANKMASDGWEPVNLDSRRLVFRRAK